MKINATDITNVYYNGNADALYKGDNKIWPSQEHYTEIVVDLSLRKGKPNNTQFALILNDYMDSEVDVDYKKVDWGDGAVTYGVDGHEYKDNGIYTIKFGCYYSTRLNEEYVPCIIKLNRLNDIGYTSLEDLFNGCTNLTSDREIVIPKKVTSIRNMFKGCTNFNGKVILQNGITNCTSAFEDCTSFNQPITIPSTATACMSMFEGCTSFNQPIELPLSVTNCLSMFKNCTAFNQPIELPLSVTDCSQMFRGCTALTSVISNWNKTYTKSIKTTNCYLGCTSIDTIDGNPGTLDNIPTTWGGKLAV